MSSARQGSDWGNLTESPRWGNERDTDACRLFLTFDRRSELVKTARPPIPCHPRVSDAECRVSCLRRSERGVVRLRVLGSSRPRLAYFHALKAPRLRGDAPRHRSRGLPRRCLDEPPRHVLDLTVIGKSETGSPSLGLLGGCRAEPQTARRRVRHCRARQAGSLAPAGFSMFQRCRLEALKIFNWRMAWELERGVLNPAMASAAYSRR